MIPITSNLPMICHEMYHFSGSQTLSHAHARFLCLLNGEITVELHRDSYRLQSGDILFLPPELSYRIEAKKPALLLYLCIHPWLLLSAFGQARFHIQTFYSDALPEQKSSLNAHIAELIPLCLNLEEGDSLKLYAKVYELFSYLSRHCMEAPKESSSDHARHCPKACEESSSDRSRQKLLLLDDWLGRHYTESISLGDAAASLDYTPQYLASFLKKHVGLTFQEYLNTFRLDAAMVCLRYSSEPPAKIALLCGFPNQGALVKAFEKSAGRSMEDFLRQVHKEETERVPLSGIAITNHPLTLDYIFNYMNYSAAASFSISQTIKRQVPVSCKHSAALPRLWSFLINMGSARDFDKPTFRYHLTKLQMELHFQYGRCTELFSLARVYTVMDKKTYDFSRIFRLIDFLLSIHLKPFFDIDCKPFRLYKESELDFLDYREYLSADSYDEFLFDVLPVFVKSCIVRYGLDEFSTWKFELWRRYNSNMSSMEAPADYCRRFGRVAEILKSLVPSVQIGGPGFNGFLSTERFADLLTPFTAADYRPDFISAYYFPYAVLPGDNADAPSGYGASTTPYSMVHKISEWKSMLKTLGFESLPLYLTEYSAHISLENYINDSLYPAAYIFHQNIQNYGMVDGLGYWLATDFSLQYGQPNSPLFGGNGLLTKHGIKKPSFHAHTFLNHLGTRLLARNEHFIAAASENGSIQVLAYHFGTLKQSFAVSPTNRELLHYPYSAFDDSRPLTLTLTLSDLSPGAYRVKEFALDLNHGNVLSIWGQLNHTLNIGEDEIRYLESQSVPSMKIHTEELSDSYELRTVLNHNEARLILLELYH